MAAKLLLGLDVGSVRIGVAAARDDIRIARPLLTLDQGPDIYDRLAAVVAEQEAAELVVGWPRGLDGQATAQTASAEAFADGLRQHLGLPVHLQDEALTSHQAEAELTARKKRFAKGEVDALAAVYILDDYLREGRSGHV